jgi:hypothetical protein
MNKDCHLIFEIYNKSSLPVLVVKYDINSRLGIQQKPTTEVIIGNFNKIYKDEVNKWLKSDFVKTVMGDDSGNYEYSWIEEPGWGKIGLEDGPVVDIIRFDKIQKYKKEFLDYDEGNSAWLNDNWLDDEIAKCGLFKKLKNKKLSQTGIDLLDI